MTNIWMVLSLHDNDFWLDFTFLGELTTRIMKFLDSKKLQEYLLSSSDYKEYLKASLLETFISIYKLRHLLDYSSYLPNELNNDINVKAWLDTDNDSLVKLSSYFKEHFKLYFSSEELNHAIDLINTSALSKNLSEVKYIDELQICNGNYEYLIIHCCDWECKSLVI